MSNTTQAQMIMGVVLSMKGPKDSDFVELAEVVDFPGLGTTAQNVDVTTIADRQKKYIAGMADPGELSLKVNFVTKDKKHQELYEAQFKSPKDTYTFKVALSDNTVFEWPAEVGGVKFEGGQAGSTLCATISMGIKGEIKATWAK